MNYSSRLQQLYEETNTGLKEMLAIKEFNVKWDRSIILITQISSYIEILSVFMFDENRDEEIKRYYMKFNNLLVEIIGIRREWLK
ncbi:hypothetical protein [Virgibacillus sp. CBA3643]|uniref:hypothetical protein n=1 Tax=Virgibacillus sp. CBA3643 TaxID=2942278 RepID=UPI0035A30995